MDKATITNLELARVSNPPAKLATENQIISALIDQVWMVGEIRDLWVDSNFLTANFDNTGLGKIEPFLNTWAICNGLNGTPDLGGKLIVGYKEGYTQGTDPIDFKFGTLKTNNLGSKVASLVLANLPPINVNEAIQNGTGDQTVPAGSTPYFVGQSNNKGGTSAPFTVMPPYGVALKIMRIA